MSGANLYIMVKPPPDRCAVLRCCRGRYDLDDHYDPDRFHCTMLPLGEARSWPGREMARLCDALAMLDADPFEIVLSEIEGRVLRGSGGAGLAVFRQKLKNRIAALGVALPPYKFGLHLSLAYVGRTAPRARIDPAIGWKAEAFQLILSRNGHVEIGRWPLRRRQYALAL